MNEPVNNTQKPVVPPNAAAELELAPNPPVEAVVASKSWMEWAQYFQGWGATLQSAMVAGVVSAVISGLVVMWGTARIETSKEEIASIVRQKSALDSAQTTVFSQLGLYTGKLFDKPESASKDELNSAIVTMQLQVNRLLTEVPKSNHPVILEYSKELGK